MWDPPVSPGGGPDPSVSLGVGPDFPVSPSVYPDPLVSPGVYPDSPVSPGVGPDPVNPVCQENTAAGPGCLSCTLRRTLIDVGHRSHASSISQV